MIVWNERRWAPCSSAWRCTSQASSRSLTPGRSSEAACAKRLVAEAHRARDRLELLAVLDRAQRLDRVEHGLEAGAVLGREQLERLGPLGVLGHRHVRRLDADGLAAEAREQIRGEGADAPQRGGYELERGGLQPRLLVVAAVARDAGGVGADEQHAGRPREAGEPAPVRRRGHQQRVDLESVESLAQAREPRRGVAHSPVPSLSRECSRSSAAR